MKKAAISIVVGWLGLCFFGYADMVTGLSANVVAYYSFDNAGDLGHDDSGNGNDLAAYGVIPDYDAAGQIGGASASDGTQGWITPVDSVALPSFTFAAWINPTSIAGLYWGMTSPSSTGFRTYVAGDKLYFSIYQNNTATVAGGASVAYGQWQHVALTFEATSGPVGGVYTGTLKAYVGGTLIQTKTDAQYTPSSQFRMQYTSSSANLTGSLDEVYFCDAALTGSDVARLAGKDIPPHLVAYYSFDNAGDLGHDDSENGNNLAVYGVAPDYDADGQVGGASASDGTQGWITPVDSVALPSFTFAAWINPTSVTGYYWGMTSPSSTGFRTYVSSDKFYFSVYQNNTATTAGGASVAYGQWQHVALTFEATSGPVGDVYTGTLKAYAGGNLIQTKTDVQYTPASQFRMQYPSSSANLNGSLDEIYLFDIALTDSEIYELAQQGVIHGYPGWAEQWGVDIGAATNDYDGDGLINLYEYALGGNPTNALDTGTSPQFGTVEQGGTTYFGYVYPQLSDVNSGLTYWLQTSTNLVSGTWTNAGYTVLGTNVTGGELNMVSNYTDTVDRQKFIRLMISTNTP